MTHAIKMIELSDTDLDAVAGGVTDICTPDDPNGEGSTREEAAPVEDEGTHKSIVNMQRGCMPTFKLATIKVKAEGRPVHRFNPGMTN